MFGHKLSLPSCSDMMSGRDLAGIAEVFMGAFMLEYQDVIYGGWDWLLHMGVECEVKVRAQIFLLIN